MQFADEGKKVKVEDNKAYHNSDESKLVLNNMVVKNLKKAKKVTDVDENVVLGSKVYFIFLWGVVAVMFIILISGATLFKAQNVERLWVATSVLKRKTIATEYGNAISLSIYNDYTLLTISILCLLTFIALNVLIMIFKKKKYYYFDFICSAISVLLMVAIVIFAIVKGSVHTSVTSAGSVYYSEGQKGGITFLGGIVIFLTLFYAAGYCEYTLNKYGHSILNFAKSSIKKD